jgi:hypothetical protein
VIATPLLVVPNVEAGAFGRLLLGPVEARPLTLYRGAEMSRLVEQRQSITPWTECEDLRFQQVCVREERFFDAGYEMGWEAGIAQFGAFARGRDATAARRQVHRMLVSSDLSRTERALVLLKVARALLCSADTGPDTSKAG